MSVDLIRYDLLVQDALRGVVGRVLTDVARDGLPGDHHLYLSFDTCAPGVRLSPRLKERYPEEMTIVLQHQFWDLVVTDQFFEVGLSFNGIPERLHIPFAALKGFFDPSVKFGLQFEPMAEEEEDDEGAEDGAGEAAPAPVTEIRPTSVPSTRAPRPAGSDAKVDATPEADTTAPKPARPAAARPAQPAAPTAAKVKPTDAARDAKDADAAGEATPAVDEGAPKEGGAGGAQVVRLDAFRKK